LHDPHASHADLSSSRGRALEWLRISLTRGHMLPFQGGANLPRFQELVWASLLLSALVGVVYIGHVIRGGWYLDDWAIVANLHRRSEGILDVIGSVRDYRPGAQLAFRILYRIGGTGQAPYLLAGVVLTTLECLLFYTALRLLRIRPLHAGSAAGLLATVPFVDATRLWMSAFPSTIAICLYLAGLNVALLGFKAVHRRRRIAWHSAALVLYAAACLTYELVIPLVCATALLYAVSAGWHNALRRLPFDLLVSGGSLLLVAHQAQQWRNRQTSLDYLLDRAREVWHYSVEVFRFSLPMDKTVTGPVGLAIVIACGVGIGRALEQRSASARAIRAWVLVGLAGLAFALLGLVMLLPADSYYVPRWTGIGDRFSGVAVLGTMVMLTALAWLFALGVAALLHRPGVAVSIGLTAIAVTGIGFARQELRNQDAWAKSWQLSQGVVSAVRAAVGPDVPPNSGIVTFRHPLSVLPDDVPVFQASWDLNGAVQLLYEDSSITSRPFLPGSVCGVVGIETPGAATLPYGKLWFVDVEHRRAGRVTNRRTCKRAIASLSSPGASGA
jgi:hypothetical protein